MLQTIDNQGNPSTMSLVLGYIGPESENGKVQAGDFFKFMDGFQMPGSVTEEMFDGDLAYYINGASKSNFNTDAAKFKMSFTAHAIQAAEIDTIEEAYTAYFTQN